MFVPVRLLIGALAVLVLAGCGSPELVQMPSKTSDEVIPSFALPPAEAPQDPRQVLSLVPASATTVTLTNYVAIRHSNGFPNLDGTSTRERRDAFWSAVAEQTVLLVDPLLRGPAEAAVAPYGFGPEDLQFEVRFEGPDGDGYVLGLRPGVRMADVRRAVDAGAGPLADASVLEEQFLVARGIAGEGEQVWSDEPDLHRLTSGQVESTYLHRGCARLEDALGPEATPDQAAQLRADYDLAQLLGPLEVFSMSFDRSVATGRLGVRRSDLIERTDIAEDWPAVGDPAFRDGFGGLPLFDTSTGRVGLNVADPVAAAALTRANRLPFAICAE